MSELPAGTITLGDVFRELTGMRADITRALERIAVIDNRNAGADATHADHEARLRVIEAAMPDNAQARLSALESFRARLVGLSAISSLISGGIGAWIGWMLSRIH